MNTRTCCLAISLVAASRTALAQTAPAPAPAPPLQPLPLAAPEPSEADELLRLRGVLHVYGQAERARRKWVGGTGVAVGVLEMGTGIGYLGASNSDARPSGYILVIGGAVTSGLSAAVTLGLGSGDAEDLVRLLDNRVKDKRPASTVVREVEAAWKLEAESAYARRVVGGYTLLLVGAGLGSYGASQAFTERGQVSFLPSSGLMFAGAFTMLSGATQIAIPSPLESGLDAYRASTGRASLNVSASAAPLPGGGMLGLNGSF